MKSLLVACVLFLGLLHFSYQQSISSCTLSPANGAAFNGTLILSCTYSIVNSAIGGGTTYANLTVFGGRNFNGFQNPQTSDYLPIAVTGKSGTCTKGTGVLLGSCAGVLATSDPNTVSYTFNVFEAIRAPNWTFTFSIQDSLGTSKTLTIFTSLSVPGLTVTTNPSNATQLQGYVAGAIVPLTLTVQNTGSSTFNSPVSCLITLNSGLAPTSTNLPSGCSIVSLNSVQCQTATYFNAGATQSWSINASYTGGVSTGSVLNVSCQDQKKYVNAQVRTLTIGGTPSPSVSPSYMPPSDSPTISPSPVASTAPGTSSETDGGDGSGADGTDGGADGNTDGGDGGAASTLFNWVGLF